MANIATIHERIKLLVEKKAENKNTVFAQTLGVSEANIRGYIKGVVPKADVLAKIVSSYEDVSPIWLLTGEGDMLKTNTSSADVTPCPDEKERKTEKNGEKQRRSEKNREYSSRIHKLPEGSIEGIPLIPASAMAGAFTSDVSIMEYE